MSRLLAEVGKYLAIRRALGFKLERAGVFLPRFVAHLEANHSRLITSRLALDWARQPPNGHPQWWAERLSIVRGFAKYLQAEDHRHEVPASDRIPSHELRRAVPVLFSASEVSALLYAASRERLPLVAGTYKTLFGLLAATGMRVGEAIRLERDDVDWKAKLLVVRQSKFGKSREVMLHPSAMRALARYAKLRDAYHPRSQSPRFFLSLVGTPLIYNSIQNSFQRLARAASIRAGRLHDLRHSFAVGTLLRWYRKGVDVDTRMPRLSTYLGHVDPKSTYWYLHASPELMGIVCKKLERAQRSGS